MEQYDDASTELMMGSGDKVLLNLGNAFFEIEEDEATELCEEEVSTLQEKMDKLNEEEDDILEQQKQLKAILYARFGKSINLEEK
jgi:prefoldin subunit 4